MKRTIAVSAAAAAALGAGVASAATTHAAKLPVVKIAEAGNAITVTGTPRSGATTLAFSTDKPKQNGNTTTLVLIRLKPGVTPQQLVAGVAPDGSNIDKFGTLQTSADVYKGHGVKIETVLKPAHYVVADTGDTNNSGPHTDFTVAKSKKPAALPTPDATIRMKDYKFAGPAAIKRGSMVRTVNAGKEQHMAVAVKVPKGMTAKQIETQFKKGQDQKVGKEAKEFGTVQDDVSPGAVNQSRLTLSKGTWVLACFMTNEKGVEHTKLGMESTLLVK